LPTVSKMGGVCLPSRRPEHNDVVVRDWIRGLLIKYPDEPSYSGWYIVANNLDLRSRFENEPLHLREAGGVWQQTMKAPSKSERRQSAKVWSC
jgi:hypothetical protein